MATIWADASLRRVIQDEFAKWAKMQRPAGQFPAIQPLLPEGGPYLDNRMSFLRAPPEFADFLRAAGYDFTLE